MSARIVGRKDDHNGNEETTLAEQVVRKLIRADRMLAEGKEVADVCRELQVSAQTYYRWRNHEPSRVCMKLGMVHFLRNVRRSIRTCLADHHPVGRQRDDGP
ncbi:MAG: putative transposase [Mycobacterium sp.]|nr:putative transposase [Mycobacterium sp.]